MTHWPDVVVVAVPFLRPVRLLRLVMVGAKFWRSARTTLRRRTFSLLGSISIVSVSVAAVLMYAAERQSEGTIQTFADALWWAVATITTVGYGDVYPKTPVGRGIAVILMLIGISLFGVLTARLAAFFVVTDDQASSPHHLEMIMERLDGIVRGAVGALADELASLAAALGRAAAAYRATDAAAARAAAGSAPRRPAVGLAT